MEVRTIHSSEWTLLKKVRLAALKDAPEAFSTNLREAEQRPDSFWQLRCRDGAAEDYEICVVAICDDITIGMAVGFLDKESPDKSYLASMWVAKEYRGSNTAILILEKIILWAKNKGAQIIFAGVTPENPRAISFYKKNKFAVYDGILPKNPVVSCCDVVLTRDIR